MSGGIESFDSLHPKPRPGEVWAIEGSPNRDGTWLVLGYGEGEELGTIKCVNLDPTDSKLVTFLFAWRFDRDNDYVVRRIA